MSGERGGKPNGSTPIRGLIDCVTTDQLLVPWREHKQFLQEEKDLASLREYNRTHGYDGNFPVSEALQQIFEKIEDYISYEVRICKICGLAPALGRKEPQRSISTLKSRRLKFVLMKPAPRTNTILKKGKSRIFPRQAQADDTKTHGCVFAR
jgi:hypothetical protein